MDRSLLHSLTSKFVILVISFFLSLMISSKLYPDGILWSEADLYEWKTRTEKGPFRSSGDDFDPLIPGEWNRIVADKDAFLKNGKNDRRNNIIIDAGPTNGSAVILNHIELLSAAFYALVKEDSALKRKVVDELVWHSKQSSLKIDPSRYLKTDNGNWWQAAWFARLIMAADFVEDEFSSDERASFDSWLGDWARAYEKSIHIELSVYRFTERYDRDYTVGGVYFRNPSGTRYAYMDTSGRKRNLIDRMGRSYNNRRSGVMQFVGLFAVWTNDQVLIDRSKLYFEEWMKFSVFPDGSACEYQRNEDGGRNVQTGFVYNTINLEAYVTIADALARIGDTSLYELSTREGIYGTESKVGEPDKSLKLAIHTYFDLIEHKKAWYNAGGFISEDYRIDNVVNSVGSAPEGRQWVNEIWFAPLANRYMNDERIRSGYTRSAPNSIPYNSNIGPAGPFGPPWRGHNAIFPSVLFMFGKMEFLSNTYPSRSGAHPDFTNTDDDKKALVLDEPSSTVEENPVDTSADKIVELTSIPDGYREVMVSDLIVFGLDPAWEDGRSFEAALDGSTSTFYDYGSGGETFVGIDFGEQKLAESITFYPRKDLANRMLGGKFQGSNENSYSGYVTIYEVTNVPESRKYVVELPNNETSYRYYRYLSPPRSHGNISEFSIDFTEDDNPAPAEVVDIDSSNVSPSGSYRQTVLGDFVVFGFDPAWKSGREFEKAYDGLIESSYDFSYPDEVFTGFDLGKERRVEFLIFHPRVDKPERMLGGKFQGSNESSQSGYVTLYEVTEIPEVREHRIKLSGDKTPYRYYRYLSPRRSHGNIAEFSLEFYEDKDLLPDEWEEKFFGDSFANKSSEYDDFDSDGSVNLEEWLANTDPSDPNDHIEKDYFDRRYGVTWESLKGRNYQIEISDDNWVTKSVVLEVQGTGDQIQWTDPGSREIGLKRSYRVILQ